MKHTTALTALPVVLASVLMLSNIPLAFAPTPTFFASDPSGQNIIGIAAAPGRLLVTTYCGDPRRVMSIDSSGMVNQNFATLMARGPGCFEQYIAITPGSLGGWTPNRAFITQGPDIVQIDAIAGGGFTPFVTISSLPVTHNGIIFDHVGAWDNKMIIAGAASGEVWTVDHLGTKTKVATGLAFIEGPDVAPLSFTPCPGCILVASETTSAVYAVSPCSTPPCPVSTLIGWPSAESVHVIPPNPCSFGVSNGSFFSVQYPSTVIKFPPTDFTSLGGQILVTSEFSHTIGLLSFTGSTPTISTFQTPLNQFEGSAFVDCQALGGTGCTLGFWKNHVSTPPWTPPYTPSTTVVSVFSGATPYVPSTDTLLMALSYQGGPTLADASRLLLKQAVAALLNAADPSLNYPLTPSQVISSVNSALASGNRDTIIALAEQMDLLNNLGCPDPKTVDVNQDRTVNILDVALVAYAYGSTPTDTRWNPAADVDYNNIINILDVAQLAFYYGTTY